MYIKLKTEEVVALEVCWNPDKLIGALDYYFRHIFKPFEEGQGVTLAVALFFGCTSHNFRYASQRLQVFTHLDSCHPFSVPTSIMPKFIYIILNKALCGVLASRINKCRPGVFP